MSQILLIVEEYANELFLVTIMLLGSSAITDRYIDIELRARHASAKK